MGTEGKLVRIEGNCLTAETAQTGGMHRSEAISGSTVGARSLWMGQTVVDPHTASGAHHHGESETSIYVVSGEPVFSYREGDAVVDVATRPGDFVYVPPFVPHVESNPGDEPAVVVISRTTQEAIAVNLDAL